MENGTWDARFAAIDAVVKDMPPVERACSTCGFAEIPPPPDDPSEGWTAKCRAPIPVNIMVRSDEAARMFAAADAARWESKRQKTCPCWRAKE